MGQPLELLLIEDSEEDAELLVRALKRAGYDSAVERVATAADMRAALDKKSWDVVVSDYVMPGFGGLEALALFKERQLEVPFIIVSGHIGEEVAVAALKAGADDYVMKDRLARLAPAISRALEESAIRRAHRAAHDALRENEERFRELAENIGAVFFMFERPANGPGPIISYVSPAYEKIWGYSRPSLFSDAKSWLSAVHPEDRLRIQQSWARALRENLNEEFRIVRLDLRVRWISYRTFVVKNAEGQVYRVAAIAEDITERKRAEEELSANAARLGQMVEELRVTSEELQHRNDELSEARAKLEQRVRERTADLTAANAELQRQMNERRRLESELLEIAENERRRIGFDLHDDIGQKLMGVSLLLKALETNLAHKQVAEAEEMRKVQGLIGEVINHTHDLAHCFSDFDAQGQNLGDLLRKLLANIRKTFHINGQFQAPADLPVLSPEITVQLYKIAQEALSNAVKHGKATRVCISLVQKPGRLSLQIKNDGVPFPTHYQPTNRMGLRIMNYRAHTVGGTLNVAPDGDSGTVVSCELPCANGHDRSPPTQRSEVGFGTGKGAPLTQANADINARGPRRQIV